MDWKLADAKNRFSEVVRRALAEGPQRVTRRSDAVVVLSEKEYLQLTGDRKSFRDYLMAPGPDLDGLDLDRDQSPGRDVPL